MLNKKGKALLNEIDLYLAHDTGALELWNVLTALRGPDSEEEDQKRITTAVIRYTALPITAKRSVLICGDTYSKNISAMLNPDEAKYADQRVNVVNNHFGNHASNAFSTLGLNWGESNA